MSCVGKVCVEGRSSLTRVCQDRVQGVKCVSSVCRVWNVSTVFRVSVKCVTSVSSV